MAREAGERREVREIPTPSDDSEPGHERREETKAPRALGVAVRASGSAHQERFRAALSKGDLEPVIAGREPRESEPTADETAPGRDERKTLEIDVPVVATIFQKDAHARARSRERGASAPPRMGGHPRAEPRRNEAASTLSESAGILHVPDLPRGRRAGATPRGRLTGCNKPATPR
jgi:hypothetical protein